MTFRYSFTHTAILFGLFILFLFKCTNPDTGLFNNYFENRSLRIDYYLIGTDSSETFILQDLKKTKHWAGKSKLVTVDSMNLGNFRFNLYDSISNKLIYTKGFCSLFEEWQTTDEATHTQRSFYMVNLMPFPRKVVKYELQKRNKTTGKFITIKKLYINPLYYKTINEEPPQIKYNTLFGDSNPENKINIAFLAEGYTKDEMEKFNNDVKRVWNYITSIPPFDQYKDKFNIYAIQSVSEESGTDNPGTKTFKNTAFNFSFFTFDSERYLTSFDLKAMHDAAEIVPYDQIFILINTDKYGGSGFLNYYSATSVDNELSLKVAMHEFGHGFGGLADEYYNSETSYEDYYNLKIEPWEPNITTLVDFKSKWKSMIEKDTPIPTDRTTEFQNVVGVYEGGGYMAKGIYSPYQDCRMKSNVPHGFCPVCSRAIARVIGWYCE